jgi:predicted ATPase
MLTRLRASGFKNLAGLDVQFGPFTCIAGPNGAGKSNLFDAILFLGCLADRPLAEAALSNRDRRGAALENLFHAAVNPAGLMSFEAEMIVPPEGRDELGQQATASSTMLRYAIDLRRRDPGVRPQPELEVVREELTYIKKGEAREHLAFPHSLAWFESAVTNRRKGEAFVSTEGEGPDRVVRIHQDGLAGAPRLLRAATLPRTVLSVANAADSPTAALARREMKSWRLLQLEPSALREPDSFSAPARMSANGAHLPATLFQLAHSGSGDPNRTYAQVAAMLNGLTGDVESVSVDRDSCRQSFTLQVVNRGGFVCPARGLSDGALRFLALSVLAVGAHAGGLLAIEEPENGIHPDRIPAMIRLLENMGADANCVADSNNPLRQVIVSTHSPPGDRKCAATHDSGRKSGRGRLTQGARRGYPAPVPDRFRNGNWMISRMPGPFPSTRPQSAQLD